jgi:hypothetical protein
MEAARRHNMQIRSTSDEQNNLIGTPPLVIGEESPSVQIGGYPRAGADQCQSQNVTGFLTAAAESESAHQSFCELLMLGRKHKGELGQSARSRSNAGVRDAVHPRGVPSGHQR